MGRIAACGGQGVEVLDGGSGLKYGRLPGHFAGGRCVCDPGVEPCFFLSSLLTSKLSQSDQLLTTHRPVCVCDPGVEPCDRLRVNRP